MPVENNKPTKEYFSFILQQTLLNTTDEINRLGQLKDNASELPDIEAALESIITDKKDHQKLLAATIAKLYAE